MVGSVMVCLLMNTFFSYEKKFGVAYLLPGRSVPLGKGAANGRIYGGKRVRHLPFLYDVTPTQRLSLGELAAVPPITGTL